MKRLMLIGVLALATSAAVSTRAAEVALIPMPQEMSLAADGAEFTADANWQPKVDTVEGIPAEGYELSVTPDGALIRSSDAWQSTANGLFSTASTAHRWNDFSQSSKSERF